MKAPPTAAPRDSGGRDSTRKAAPSSPQRDSTGAVRRVLTAEDTIKAPLATSWEPGAAVVASWNREQLFAQGALTLGELVALVPGATLMTTGFLQAPQVLAWHGDVGAVRVFIDGVEREEITPRTGGVTDFALVPLWTLEQVTVEETPVELRVHARTWRVERTTASTRTDVLTGSENLNLFRGFFGKRSVSGVAIQLAAQQASTATVPGMDGDALGAMARLGWARGQWSIDGTIVRQGMARNSGARYPLSKPELGAFPAFTGSSSLAYLRAGWRNPQADGPWLQVIAASLVASKTKPSTSSSLTGTTSTKTTVADSADTTVSRAQYVVSGGINRAGLRLTGTGRMRSANGKAELSPTLHGEWVSRMLSVGATVGRRYEGTGTWDASLAARPFSWLRLSAATGVGQVLRDSAGGIATRSALSLRAAVKVRDAWISGGMIRNSAAAVPAPIVLDTAMRPASVAQGQGWVVSVTTPVWRGWNASTDVVSWNGAVAFRPQTQARTRLWFASDFSERFPQANFHLLAALTHEYRSQFYVPKGFDPLGQSTPGWSAFGSLLEIRIASAIITWDYRNMSGLNYETFPGYLMPRITSVYGIRWEFWN